MSTYCRITRVQSDVDTESASWEIQVSRMDGTQRSPGEIRVADLPTDVRYALDAWLNPEDQATS